MSGENEDRCVSIEIAKVNHGYCPDVELPKLDGDREIDGGSMITQIETGDMNILPKDELLHPDEGR